MVVDSNSKTALQASGSAQIQAASVVIVGAAKITGNATVSSAPTQGAAVSDPFAALSAPSPGTSQGAVSLTSGTQTINPGTYTGIAVSKTGNLILNPGVYILTGHGFSVSGTATVTENGTAGVTIYNEGAFGAISVTGGSVDLRRRPASGPRGSLRESSFSSPTRTRPNSQSAPVR